MLPACLHVLLSVSRAERAVHDGCAVLAFAVPVGLCFPLSAECAGHGDVVLCRRALPDACRFACVSTHPTSIPAGPTRSALKVMLTNLGCDVDLSTVQSQSSNEFSSPISMKGGRHRISDTFLLFP